MKANNMLFHRVCCAFFGLLTIAVAQAQDQCGELENAFGPYDYWTKPEEVKVVEKFHFNVDVEMLKSGLTGTSAGGDLDYTLRAIPNHPRALIAMVNLGFKEKTSRPRNSTHTVECWLVRAQRFRPQDANVKMIVAGFLQKTGRNAEAIKQLEAAQALGVSSPNMLYNMGLAYFEVKDYEQALAFAHRAYLAGYTLPGLKNKLTKAGKWREPPHSVGDSKKEAPPVVRTAPGEQ